MDLEDIQSARSRERRTDSLQPLADSFYEDAGAFVRELRAKRTEVAAAADDPFDSPDVRRLTNSIKTAENTVEAIYERRVGKVVKLASLDAAGMTPDDDGLTPEERDLFGTLTEAIEHNRNEVIEGLATTDDGTSDPTGDEPIADAEPDPRPESGSGSESDSDPGLEPEPGIESGSELDAAETDATTAASRTAHRANVDGATGGVADRDANPVADGKGTTDADTNTDVNADAVGAADAMGAPAGTAPREPGSGAGREDANTASADAGAPAGPTNAARSTDTVDAGGPSTRGGSDSDRRTDPDHDSGAEGRDRTGTGTGNESGTTDRETIRVTRDVGEIVGIDERVYELASEDVVTLPTANAKPLVDRNAAERLD